MSQTCRVRYLCWCLFFLQLVLIQGAETTLSRYDLMLPINGSVTVTQPTQTDRKTLPAGSLMSWSAASNVPSSRMTHMKVFDTKVPITEVTPGRAHPSKRSFSLKRRRISIQSQSITSLPGTWQQFPNISMQRRVSSGFTAVLSSDSHGSALFTTHLSDWCCDINI